MMLGLRRVMPQGRQRSMLIMAWQIIGCCDDCLEQLVVEEIPIKVDVDFIIHILKSFSHVVLRSNICHGVLRGFWVVCHFDK